MVERKIGAGGMASVYRASRDMLGRKVAIKFLNPEYALDPTQKERFLREARATNRIKHEHIIDITDYGEEENGIVYLVMELLEGEVLADAIARGPIPPREAIDYAVQICRALARAHELEVIHRDLKPENVFVTLREGKPHLVLLDFGLAHVSNEVRLTAMGTVFGTPEYMSPEQARGQTVGAATDLYSLGVVFFEMLTSRLPVRRQHGRTDREALERRGPYGLVAGSDPAARDGRGHRQDDEQEPEAAASGRVPMMDELGSLLTLLPAEIEARHPIEAPSKSEPGHVRVADGNRRVPRHSPRPGCQHPATTTPMSVRAWIERRVAFRPRVRRVVRASQRA